MPDHPSIDIDDEGGARAAAEHLLALGHREFLVIGVEPPQPATQMEPEGVTGRRLRGYRAALTAAGIELPVDHVVVGPATVAGGVTALEVAWSNGLRPTAVLAMSDAMSIVAIAAIHDLGLAIPDRISVVGFDDVELAESTNPPLTTVHQPVRGKGETAVRMLLSVIQGRDASPGHRRLDTRLVVRSSTGPGPQADGR
jgi:LacI family transcriptional regulator